jgi:hypothetical protein
LLIEAVPLRQQRAAEAVGCRYSLGQSHGPDAPRHFLAGDRRHALGNEGLRRDRVVPHGFAGITFLRFQRLADQPRRAVQFLRLEHVQVDAVEQGGARPRLAARHERDVDWLVLAVNP